MAVENAGDDGRTAKVDARSAGAGQVLKLRIAPHSDDTAVLDRNGLGNGAFGIQSVETAVGQNQIRGQVAYLHG